MGVRAKGVSLDVSATCVWYVSRCRLEGGLPEGCRMFQRPRDLSALSTQEAPRPQLRVHVTCDLSGEGRLAAPLSHA
jgi:hypothetical protein